MGTGIFVDNSALFSCLQSVLHDSLVHHFSRDFHGRWILLLMMMMMDDDNDDDDDDADDDDDG